MKKLLLLCISCFLFGCANRLPIAIDSSSARLDIGDQSLLLLTVDISRAEKSRFMPIPDYLLLDLPGNDGKPTGKMLPLDGDGYLYPDDEHAIYAFRVKVPPGEVRIKGITGRAKAFPISGFFVLPIGMTVQANKGAVTYIGRIDALLRPRTDLEYRAGGVIPLIDQAITGLSTGTFDVQIKDMSSEDLKLLRSAYPAIASTPIETRISSIVSRDILDRQWRGEDGKVTATNKVDTSANQEGQK